MSFESARSGDTYRTRVSSGSAPPRPPASRARASSASRNAASVLPDPVGAASSTFSPRRMAGQARAWAPVAGPSVSAPQPAIVGWKAVSASAAAMARPS